MPGYIPTDEDALVIWFNDHAVGVVTHGANVGLSPAEITQAQTDSTTVAHGVNARQLYLSKSQSVTGYKDILLYAPLDAELPVTPTAPIIGLLPDGALPGCVARARQRAERIKSHPNYNVTIGQDCVIIAPEAPPAATQPEINAVAETGFTVRLTFAMLGHDQIEIQCQRGGGDWVTITFDTNSPYIDGQAPLVPNTPETRAYRARWRDNDVPFGTWSDIVTVTAQA
jgi:hypothetical protein